MFSLLYICLCMYVCVYIYVHVCMYMVWQGAENHAFLRSFVSCDLVSMTAICALREKGTEKCHIAYMGMLVRLWRCRKDSEGNESLKIGRQCVAVT
jgi:hypothetical protein